MAVGWQRVVRNGLDVVELATAASLCSIALHGAQVLSFQPRGGRDRLWVSDKARWNVGSALRGGIPLCFPWFGPHATGPGFPAHGFARTRLWRLVGVDELPDAKPRAVFELRADEQTRPLFPYAFTARSTVIAGEDLELSFEVENDGAEAFEFEIAMHSYFAVSDIAAVSVEGLGGSSYVDKVAGGAGHQQAVGALEIAGEVDRVYTSGGPLALIDPGHPTLHLEGQGIASAVVWNPGPAKARALGDIDPEDYRRFVCLEMGNLGPGRISLAAGARHVSAVRIRNEDLGSRRGGEAR
ncbi:MAG TPA: D-hexose-6-phosphate mutarotase [Polyangia bacterium]|nr:D-hexose-6-phosphate mutarotase [Polyangia bacterium]